MQGPERPDWFVGDLGDPWVVAIADRLPPSFRRRQALGEIPDAWTTEEPAPRRVVIHRAILTPLDVIRLSRLRARAEEPCRVVLCFGPHVRHDDLVRSSRVFDVILPEATAVDTIARIINPVTERVGSRPVVQVVSGLHDIRLLLSEVCRSGGYPFHRQDSLEQAPPGITIWDVPVLTSDWPDQLARRAQTSAVIALIGFADRAIVGQAREAGAGACLEWPCDVDDLIHVLDQTATLAPKLLTDPGHIVPPTPVLIRRKGRSEVVDQSRST